MDEWKFGDGNLFGEEDDNDEGFSLGGSGLGKTETEGHSKENISRNNNENPRHLRKGQKKHANPFKFKTKGQFSNAKIALYVLLAITAFISAYYLFYVFFPGNDLNIEIFGLRERVYQSSVLPENNLLITGYIINKNKFPVGYVKLDCKLYDDKNITLLSKNVYAGNFISIKKLKKMPNVAIDMALQNKAGVNMADTEILPDHPIKIMVVFFDIPSSVKKYSITIAHFYHIK